MKNLLSTAAVALCLGGVPAFAQSVPAAVDARLEMLKALGTVEFGSRIEDGNSVEYRDVVLGDPDGEVRIAADWIRAKPSTALPGEIMIEVAPRVLITAGLDQDMPMEFEVASSALSFSANFIDADTDSPSVVLTADSLGVRLLTEGLPFLERMNISQDDLSLSYDLNMAAGTSNFALSAVQMVLDYAMAPEPRQTQDVRYVIETIGSDVQVTGLGGGGFPEFVDGGGTFEGDMSFGPISGNFKMTAPDVDAAADFTSGPSEVVASLKGGEAYLSQTGRDLVYENIAVSGPGFALPPFGARMADLLMVIGAPITATEQLVESAFRFEMNGIAVDEALWAMVDPQGAIPRDPANLQVDLAATVRLKETLGALMNYRGQAPTDVAEYESATVKNILLSVGGAKIAAAGDMTFDTAGPVPMPNGAVDVNITGVQGLVNTLSSIGLVPQAQAGMAMGMMMAFVQPGSEPDSFTSKVEFRNGQIIANGIPVGP